jgi:5-methylcytosine-specific restriction endonuclease McrA
MGKPLRDQLDPTERRLFYGGINPHHDPAQRRCQWCGGPVPKGRRTFCSEECVDELLIRTRPEYARRKVLERDHGICSTCGLDCARLERIVERLTRLASAVVWVRSDDGRPVADWWIAQGDGVRVEQRPHPAAAKRAQDLDIMLALIGLWAGHDVRKWARSWSRESGSAVNVRLKHSLWQADHIKPVVEGGGQCALDNLRTLCLRCHKGVTAELASRRKGPRGR